MITINSSKIISPMKPMHATNNGPATGAAQGKKQSNRRNFESFAALNIPYVRNHDASLSEAYGSQHVVDIHCIFPDFSRDVDDETAYDFVLTDCYTQNIMAAGSKVFYRLGSSIEHWKKKYGTVMPADFNKWAKICEHVIMHYNHGWANGFHYEIEYWEIWNEADLVPDGIENRKTWGGTKAQFFDFYAVTSKYLKSRFPELKIGGPALAGDEEWAKDFLSEMQIRKVPMDFFSWHIYTASIQAIIEKCERMQKLLDEYGYGHVENILNEWNYVRDWSDSLDYVRVIKGIKGAAFNAAVMCAGQNCPNLDMLMYYDARIEKIWNGMFSSDTLEPLKGYYPFQIFSRLYGMNNQTECICTETDIYAVSAASDTERGAMVAYYTMDDSAPAKCITLHTDFFNGADCYLLDAETDCKKTVSYDNCDITLLMQPNTVVQLIAR